jgi:hypothetical protein
MRLLQPGGRMILIVGGAGDGMLGRLKPRPTLDADAVLNLMTRCGLVATRKLGQADRIEYFEGRRTRDN